MWPAAYPGEVAATAKSKPLRAVRVRSIGLDGVRAQRGLAMTAHNVRLLCRCPVCGKLGDDQSMVKVGPMKTLAHDRCAFEQLGVGIMNLPQEEPVKFSLVAVGPDMMRRLVDAAG